jgi:hypothetical protein
MEKKVLGRNGKISRTLIEEDKLSKSRASWGGVADASRGDIIPECRNGKRV